MGSKTGGRPSQSLGWCGVGSTRVGIPVGCVLADANRHDCPLLRPTSQKPTRFGSDLPDQITVHLDTGQDFSPTRELSAERGCHAVTGPQGTPLPAGTRWVTEAFIALADAVIIPRRLLAQAWTTHRGGT